MKKALLVVSFGTGYLDCFQASIGAIERDLAQAFPDRTFRRAFTAGRIRARLRREHGVAVDGVVEALAALRMEGYEDVLVQPTYLINGEQMEALEREASVYARQFSRFTVGRPLLSTIEDYLAMADAVIAGLPELGDEDALVLVGNGSSHYMNAAYACLEYVLHDKGYSNVYVGTVEGYPTLQEVLHRLDEAWNIRRVCLMPLLITAGGRSRNDIAGDSPDSWESQIKQHRLEVTTVQRGLGENPAVRALIVRHAQEALRGGSGWLGL